MKIIIPNEVSETGKFSRASAAHYWGADASLKLAAVDEPRFNYHQASGFTQLLCEAEASNYLTYPRNLNQASWSLTNLLAYQNAGSAPDGANNCQALIESAGLSVKQFAQPGLQIYAQQKYAYSLLVKAKGRDFLYASLNTAAFAFGEAYFDLKTKTCKAYGAAEASLTDCGNGWLYLTLCATASTDNICTAVDWRLSANGNDAGNYFGDGISGIYLFHAQFEKNLATSIIPDNGVYPNIRAAEQNTTSVSSTIAEDEFPEWNASTNYEQGAQVLRKNQHKIYKRNVAGTSADTPEVDSKNWTEIGPSNRWALFDNVIGTQSSANNRFSIVTKLGVISGLALLELKGRQVQLTVRDKPGGSTVFQQDYSLDNTDIQSIADWFFNPYQQKTDLIIANLPDQYFNPEVTISVIGTNKVSCGVCKYGPRHELGVTHYGARIGINDYSVKSRDAFGRISITPRAYSKRASFTISTENTDFDRITRLLTSLRATAAIYQGTEIAGYEPLSIYGFFKDFSIDVSYPTKHILTLEIEGII